MIYSENLSENWVRKMTEESYIVLYSILLSQKLSEK